MSIEVKTKTTGFGSPAESYVDKRLDLNELIVNDIKTTFYMRYMGQSTLGVKKGSVLVIDRSEQPKIGDLVVISDTSCLKIREYNISADEKYENTLMVFPSSLYHSVNPFYTSDEYRISVSGNICLSANNWSENV